MASTKRACMTSYLLLVHVILLFFIIARIWICLNPEVSASLPSFFHSVSVLETAILFSPSHSLLNLFLDGLIPHSLSTAKQIYSKFELTNSSSLLFLEGARTHRRIRI